MRRRSTSFLRRTMLGAALALSTCVWLTPASAGSDLTFGIVPQQSASRLAQIWVPVFDYLSEKTGMRIQFATAKDIPAFEACLARGAYDLAYMKPLSLHHLPRFWSATRPSPGRRKSGSGD